MPPNDDQSAVLGSTTAETARTPSLVTLGLITVVSPLATDMYLSALPIMQRSLGTTAAMIQLTLTTFIVGFAVGQLVCGPLSDRLGRRPFVLGGTVVFAVSSVLCAVAPSAWLLVSVRSVQGLAAGTAVAVIRAMVTDRYSGPAVATRMGTLISLLLLGPIVAPPLGGVVLALTGWRGNFVLMAGLGVVMVAAAAVGLPETRQPVPVARKAPEPRGSSFAQLWRLRAFRAQLVVAGLGSAGNFVYIGASSFVFQDQLGASPATYALAFTVVGAAMAAASLGFRLGVTHLGTQRLQRAGVGVAVAATLLLAGLALGLPGSPSIGVVWALLAVALAGTGLSAPATSVQLQEAGRRYAGTASALNGGVAYIAGAITAPALGLLGHTTVLVLGLGMALCYLGQLTVLLLTRGVPTLSVTSPEPSTSRSTNTASSHD